VNIKSMVWKFSCYGKIMVETEMIHSNQHPIHTGMMKATLSLMEMTMTMNPHPDELFLQVNDEEIILVLSVCRVGR
jgi:hypothetical protein